MLSNRISEEVRHSRLRHQQFEPDGGGEIYDLPYEFVGRQQALKCLSRNIHVYCYAKI